MALVFVRRRNLIMFSSLLNSHFRSMVRNSTSNASTIPDKNSESSVQDDSQVKRSINGIHLSPLFSNSKPHAHGYDIELVDPESWRVSSGLSQAWKGKNCELEPKFVDQEVDFALPFDDDDEPDFDEIEDMRIRGSLFYKLDRNSMEFEEYNYNFHRKKSSKNKIDKQENKDSNSNSNPSPKSSQDMKDKFKNSPISTMEIIEKKKKLRTLTYNQLTGPYHEPFCLDIYISKGSVRACIVHRATSNVVAVAHSISKDMKFDLESTRDVKACVAVGSVLAQRALDDDIHDVIYTPRKGEKLEGKLLIVLNAVMNNGVNVKVNIKQRHKKGVRQVSF